MAALLESAPDIDRAAWPDTFLDPALGIQAVDWVTLQVSRSFFEKPLSFESEWALEQTRLAKAYWVQSQQFQTPADSRLDEMLAQSPISFMDLLYLQLTLFAAHNTTIALTRTLETEAQTSVIEAVRQRLVRRVIGLLAHQATREQWQSTLNLPLIELYVSDQLPDPAEWPPPDQPAPAQSRRNLLSEDQRYRLAILATIATSIALGSIITYTAMTYLRSR